MEIFFVMRYLFLLFFLFYKHNEQPQANIGVNYSFTVYTKFLINIRCFSVPRTCSQKEEDPEGNQKVLPENPVRYLHHQTENKNVVDDDPDSAHVQIPGGCYYLRPVRNLQDLVRHQAPQAPPRQQGHLLRECAPPTPLRA